MDVAEPIILLPIQPDTTATGAIPPVSTRLTQSQSISANSPTYASGSGVWMGINNGVGMFSVGPLTFDGTTLNVPTISATSGTIAGFTIAAQTITGTGLILSSLGNASLALGTTPPSSPTTGTGLYLDKTGVFGLASNVQNFILSATDGSITANKGTIGGTTITSTTLGSSGFVTGSTGYQINSSTGIAEFYNIIVRGIIRTAVFEKDVVSAVGGQLIITNADALASDMTALDSATLTIKANTTFAVNDILYSKNETDEEYFRVTSIASAPTYSVTRDLAGAYSANNNPTWKAGTAIVKLGKSDGASTFSGGYLRLLGEGTNSPRYSVYKRTGIAYNAITEYVGLGNLNGLLDYVSDEYGISVGTATDGYIAYDPTNGLRVSASKISFKQRFTAGWGMTQGDVTAIESDGKNYRPRYTANASTATATGSISSSSTLLQALVVGHLETATAFTTRVFAVLNGCSYYTSLVAEDPSSFSSGTSGSFASGSHAFPCAVDNTTICAVYFDGTNVKGLIFSGLDTTVTVNTVVSIVANSTEPVVAMRTATQLLCVYQVTASGAMEVCVLTVSGGTTFTVGGANTVLASGCKKIWSMKRYSTSDFFLVSYEDTSDNQKVICIQYDGSTFTIGSAVTIIATTTNEPIDLDSLDSTRMIAAYVITTGAITAVILSRSGTTITAGTSVAFDTQPIALFSTHVLVAALGRDTFAFGYAYLSGPPATNKHGLARVTGTTITTLGSLVTDSGLTGNFIAVLKINPKYYGTVWFSGSTNIIFSSWAPPNTYSQVIGIQSDTVVSSSIGGVTLQGYSADVTGLSTATPYYVDTDGALITRAQGGLQRFGIALSATTIKVE